jgi:predicted dehydrogenase
MRFALLGSHPDGLALADSLLATGRHELIAYTTAPPGAADRWGSARLRSDLEEVLADPSVEAVIVAGTAVNRPQQLRRALQSERHVLCVQPVDQTPEVGYEAALIRQDTGYVLLPLSARPLHPAIRRLAELVRRAPKDGDPSPLGEFRLLEVDWAEPGEVLANLDPDGRKPSFPCWDVLRALGGEIAEVSAFAAGEHAAPGEPVLLTGRFEKGGLFRVTLLPQAGSLRRCRVVGRTGRAELTFPLGDDGPAFLECPTEPNGTPHEEHWPRWDPWPEFIARFEAAVALPRPMGPVPVETPEGGGPVWRDAVRGLELDDAARRSLERRRASLLEYPEATEEVGFKGTMTLLGCAMLWAVLGLVILSRWLPLAGWLIVPLLAGFLLLQLLRYLLPPQPTDQPAPAQTAPASTNRESPPSNLFT